MRHNLLEKSRVLVYNRARERSDFQTGGIALFRGG